MSGWPAHDRAPKRDTPVGIPHLRRMLTPINRTSRSFQFRTVYVTVEYLTRNSYPRMVPQIRRNGARLCRGH